MSTLIVRGERVVLPEGVRPARIHAVDGRITEIFPTLEHARTPALAPWPDQPVGAIEFDAGQRVVMPGLVDTHVHINDPGRAGWEGFEHATRAAVAAGVTTLVDMPLNSIPATTSVAALEAKWRAAAGKCHVDVACWGGVVPGNRDALVPLVRAGVPGFKCFLVPSGVDEFANVNSDDLESALPLIAELDVPLLVHAELPGGLRHPQGDPRRYATWLDSRPPVSEKAAIDWLIRLARQFGVRVHIVHLATPDALPAIAAARAAGVRISVETCPHYLTFAAGDIPDGATAFKCAPPIRGAAEREGLWRALIDGAIDLVATDHSPSPPSLKHLADGDFLKAWGGIASLQVGWRAVWTAAHARGLGVDRVVEWMSAAPARLAGLDRVKGRIAVGADADLVIWDPDAEMVVDAATLSHRHAVTPYDGMRLRGMVHWTFLRGQPVFCDGRVLNEPRGRITGGGIV